MPDLIVSVTDPQLKVLRQMDANVSARQVLQTHVNTWLKPFVDELAVSDRKQVAAAYLAASPTVQTQVKGLLGLV